MIRGIPVILNKWSRETSLLKVDLSYVLVWVKFHDVPIVAYSSDGLNSIAYKIGNPMLLDSYTNEMCLESWGVSIKYLSIKVMVILMYRYVIKCRRNSELIYIIGLWTC